MQKNNTTFNFYTNGSNTTAAFTFTLGTWYHIAMVRSGTNKYIYINGTKIGTGTYTGAINTTTPGAITFWSILGFNSGNTNDGVAKTVQDFRFYLGTDKGYTGATITPPASIVVKN